MVEVYINNIRVDLKKDLPLSLNFALSDIREPETREGSFTKTLNLAGSKVNNELFGLLHNVDTKVGTFDPNIKLDAKILSNGITVFEGVFQLQKINVLEDHEISYEGIIFGRIAALFVDIGDDELTDLDYSEMDHTYNKTYQQRSWTHLDSPTQQAGEYYVYAMIDKGENNAIDWDVEHFYPSIYLKEYVDKIIEAAGYTYESNFLSSNYFRNLIVPFNSDAFKLSTSEIEDREVSAFSNLDSSGAIVSGANRTVVGINDESVDIGNNFNTGTYEYTAPAGGRYAVYFSGNAFVDYTGSGNLEVANTPIAYLEIIKEDTLGNKSVVAYRSSILAAKPLGTGFIDNLQGAQTFITLNTNSAIFLDAGDKIYVQHGGYLINRLHGTTDSNPFVTSGTTTPVSGTISTFFSASSALDVRVINDRIYEGSSFSMNNAVPQEIKQRELLLSVIKAFNLFVEPDRSNPKKLYIEPRDDFYTSGSTLDWSHKLDTSKPFVIEPMGGLDAREYIFTYEEDKDYWNTQYDNRYDEVYGSRIIDVTNDFVTQKRENKLIFASTPSIGYSFSDRVLPAIIFHDNNGIPKNQKSKIRMLYYGGVKPTIDAWNYVANSGTTQSSVYPYSGHLDDPYLSSEDIQFIPPKEIYFTSGLIYYTNNNLYNKYHKKFIEEITNKDSKIITCWLRLTPLDINTFDFRNKVYIDNQTYYVNRIIDNDPEVEGVTEVELFKLVNGVEFTPTSGYVGGGNDPDPIEPTIGNEFPPTLRHKNDFEDRTNNVIFANAEVNKFNGTISGGVVTGVGNAIGDNSSGVTIINSDNNTALGDNLVFLNSRNNQVTASNVLLINTTGQVIEEGGVTYLGNNKFQNTVIGHSHDLTQTTAVTTEETLATFTLPSGSLKNIGDSVKLTSIFSMAANTNAKSCKVEFFDRKHTFTTSVSGDYVVMEARATRTLQYDFIDAIDKPAFMMYVTVSSSGGVSDAQIYANYFEFDTDDFEINIYGQNGTASAQDISLFNSDLDIFLKHIPNG